MTTAILTFLLFAVPAAAVLTDSPSATTAPVTVFMKFILPSLLVTVFMKVISFLPVGLPIRDRWPAVVHHSPNSRAATELRCLRIAAWAAA